MAGAGAGHLIEYLLAQGARVWGIEQAPALADRANKHLHGRPGFMGVSVPSENRWQLPSRSVDVVFATEVIEHLGDTELDAFFTETHRILRHGGTVIISTPHNEDLDGSAIVCPACGCLFHPMQHVRSWTTSTISEYALSHGIAPVASLVTALPVVGGISRLGRLKNHLLSFTLPAESNLLFAGKVPDGDAGQSRGVRVASRSL